jgi:hypothetical protein
MRNNLQKKVSLVIILILVLGILSAGCGGTTPPPPPPPPPTCYLTVYSQCGACWGFVWVNGLSTGQWIAFNGAVTVTGLSVGTVASVQIFDNFGWLSHPEIRILVSGNNIVIFDYW